MPLRRHLSAHEVATVYELSWSALQNGALIMQAETSGFDVLVTTDRQWKYQQNLTKRRLAVVVLLSTSWPKIRTKAEAVAAAINNSAIGSYIEVDI